MSIAETEQSTLDLDVISKLQSKRQMMESEMKRGMTRMMDAQILNLFLSPQRLPDPLSTSNTFCHYCHRVIE